jgi:ribosomal protein S18 acetylase RimI-like enzyme
LDDATTTLHVGAFVNGSLVSVATICREPMPNNSDAGEWRLRGMATVDNYRGKGLGKRLAEHCVAHALSEGGSLVWCSARVSAIGFYRSLGFEEQPVKPFSLPEYSQDQYVLMMQSLPSHKG